MLKKIISKKYVLLVLASAFSFPGSAAVYKWVDEHGVQRFSDERPENFNAVEQKIEIKNVYKAPTIKKPSVDKNVKTEENIVTKEPQKLYADDKVYVECVNSGMQNCFTKSEDMACSLRYGISCEQLLFWKSDAIEKCKESRSKNCNSPSKILSERPSSLLLRDLDKKLPIKPFVNDGDFGCLKTSGFYCQELENDVQCKEEYGVDCGVLSSWVDTAFQQCEKQRSFYCDDEMKVLKEYRPRSIEEIQRTGTQGGGRRAIRDRIFEKYGSDAFNQVSAQEFEVLLSRYLGY